MSAPGSGRSASACGLALPARLPPPPPLFFNTTGLITDPSEPSPECLHRDGAAGRETGCLPRSPQDSGACTAAWSPNRCALRAPESSAPDTLASPDANVALLSIAAAKPVSPDWLEWSQN